MDERTERELHELTLNAITHGRLLAQEWKDAGLLPHGSTKQLTLELLQKLSDRSELNDLDEERIELLGNQICRITNDYCEGLGDRALETDIETENVHDTKVIDLINLAWRCDNILTHIEAIRSGVGIGVTHQGLAAQWPEVEQVLPDIQLPSLDLWIACHSDVRNNKRIRLVVDFLGEALQRPYECMEEAAF